MWLVHLHVRVNCNLELYTYNPSIGFFSGQNVGAVGDNLSFIGCANLFGNGATQMGHAAEQRDVLAVHL
jgi:hypothetical protein